VLLGLRKGTLIAVVLAAFFLLAVQAFAPYFLRVKLEEGLAEALAPNGPVQATVRAPSALRLLGGTVDRVHAEAEGVFLDGLRVDKLFLEGINVRADVLHFLRTGELDVKDADFLEATFHITEEDIDAYLAAQPYIPGSFTAVVDRDGMTLAGEVVVLGQRWPVGVTGVFEVAGATRIDFVPSGITVDRLTIPRTLLANFVEVDDFRIGFDIGVLPLSLQVTHIDFEPSRLIVRARSALVRQGASFENGEGGALGDGGGRRSPL